VNRRPRDAADTVIPSATRAVKIINSLPAPWRACASVFPPRLRSAKLPEIPKASKSPQMLGTGQDAMSAGFMRPFHGLIQTKRRPEGHACESERMRAWW
jgi:hypothetical protein